MNVLKTLYPAKILVAWAESIAGNKKITEWLMLNGYKELGIFLYALHNKDDARDWLLKNGFPHLQATIAGAEGNQNAINWLLKYKFDVLSYVARAGDGDGAAFTWLIQNGHREMAMIAKRIEFVKDEIERDNNDAHKISKE